MSKPVNGASEQSEHGKAQRCKANEPSEQWKQADVASDNVAHKKRDCLGLKTRLQ